ncbi:DUF547 domain-containing protein [candidate division KSB1 bacterium]|nr:DUF547 domain-containing protein [candidate division KSB1 bacterium]
MKQCIGSITILLLMFTISRGSESLNHVKLDSVLQLYVHDGLVDYEGIKVLPRLLDTYIRQVRSVSRTELDDWSRNEQTAFWLNVYNAFVLKFAVRNYPIEWGNIWQQARYPRNSIYQISGFYKKRLNLQMEPWLNLKAVKQRLLSGALVDPRMIFALCDGTQSGALIPTGAFIAERLETQLNLQVSRFLGDPSRVRIDTLKNELHLSCFLQDNKDCFPQPGGNWDQDFAADNSTEANLGIEKLQADIERITSEIAAMKAIPVADSTNGTFHAVGEDSTLPDASADSLQPPKIEKRTAVQRETLLREKESQLEALQRKLAQRTKIAGNKNSLKRLIDYDREYHGIILFLMNYLSPASRDYLRSFHPEIKFMSRDVRLNDTRHPQ